MSAVGIALLLLGGLALSALVSVIAPHPESSARPRESDDLSSARRRERVRVNEGRTET